jgi:cation:H+ antiporter
MAIAMLVYSADFFVEGAKGLARKLGVAEILIGLTIVSLGTSFPEILVGSSAAYSALTNGCAAGADCPTDFALGNIFGSVLVQITLILGIVVIFRPLSVRPSWLERDGLLMFMAVLLLALLIIVDGGLSRLEGLLLVCLYIYYIVYLIQHRERIRNEEFEVIEEIRKDEIEPTDWSPIAYFSMLIIGLGAAMFASMQVVDAAIAIAESTSISSAVIGSTVSAVGTSIPELTVALMAAKRSQGVAIGTLIGSNITDPLLSVGIAAMIHPLNVVEEGIFYTLIIPVTVISTGVCLLFMWTGFRFNRWEGGLLVGMYFIFLAIMLGMQGF